MEANLATVLGSVPYNKELAYPNENIVPERNTGLSHSALTSW